MEKNVVGRILDGRGIRQTWLAEQLGISDSYLSYLLSGARPWTQRLKRETARLLMVPEDVLFFATECSHKTPDMQSPATDVARPADLVPAGLREEGKDERVL